VTWKIESIDWGDNQIWDFSTSGVLTRYRQDATVHLLEKVVAETVAIGAGLPGNSRSTAKSGGVHGTHVVQQGETLAQIAVKEYKGDRSKWRDIAKANGVIDPRSIVVGQTLVLP
jgi:nucleoid-associated protein YgaU